jgi:hypothetical protein
MTIPGAESPIWQQIIRGRERYKFEHLGAQILLGRARIELAHDSSEATVQALARELHSLFVENASHPKIVSDLRKLTG